MFRPSASWGWGIPSPVISLADVHKRYGPVRALDGVSLELQPGRTVGLVGESGSGKSTAGRLILGLERPTAGELLFHGAPYPRTSRRLRPLRRTVSMVFQDPYDSLDARFKVRDVVAEPLRAHGLWRNGGAERVDELFAAVGLEGVARETYPTELSGGQRQRLGIARALATAPDLVVCDEPTSALDVSVQAQILNLLLRLQAELGVGYLFITHDLDVVRRISDDVVVLYAGTVVEQGPAADVALRPQHPYTQALVGAIPSADPANRRLAGRRPAPEGIASAAATGCPFATRCPRVTEICRAERPPLTGGAHAVACYHPGP
jgi:oligopeptide/dipeptide ABC transporter ATP-binding protein